jgi:hypothetical protein
MGSHRGREGEKGGTGLGADTHEQVLSHIGESKPVIFHMNMDQTNEQQCHYNEYTVKKRCRKLCYYGVLQIARNLMLSVA